ncbi:MAG TPA: flagellar motor switch protein FliG [Armatimonadetes bacterium]|nr:flagellar motor switch protein FliG [Armatimonadota bacterium]
MEEGISLSGPRKAAVLLLAIGAERAGKVLKHLSEKEVEEISLEILRMRSVPPEAVEQILEEYRQMSRAVDLMLQGGEEAARKMLEGAFGVERADALVQSLREVLEEGGFPELRGKEPELLARLLSEESPQAVAVVLAHLPLDFASSIFTRLPKGMKAEVGIRLAKLSEATPEALEGLHDAIRKKLAEVGTGGKGMGGIERLARLLNRADKETEMEVLERIAKENEELAQQVRDKMFTFEDIAGLDDRTIQRILQEVDLSRLALALKGVPEEIRERFLKNLSQRAREMVLEDMEYMGPVKVAEVREAQKEVVEAARRLEESGDIVISRGGEDEVVV